MVGIVVASVLICTLAIAVYAVRLNRVMASTPTEAWQHLKGPLTVEGIRSTHERIKRDGIDWASYLPPRRERRYIIVGGSGRSHLGTHHRGRLDLIGIGGRLTLAAGLVGSTIVLQLLRRGTPPGAVRIVDVRKPYREEQLGSPASDVSFFQVDITSGAAVLEAFEAPWPPSVSGLPLTVFHTAAVIIPGERSPLVYHRCARVNLGGTANVLSAARAVGAGLLVYTSSSIINVRPVQWFFAPWRRSRPDNYFQILTEKDFFEPRSELVITNYARSKAEAERLICGADERGGMRTGAIRPGNGVYGSIDDHIVGRMLAMKRSPTFVAPWVQSWIHAGNVALAHLQYEDALLGAHVDKVAARPFLVTNSGPPMRFRDLYLLLDTLSVTGFKVDYPPPLLLLLLAYAIEAYALLLVRLPVLKRVFAEPQDPVVHLQPGTFVSSVTCIIDDSSARRRPEDGGIGYQSACTSVEGFCALVLEWNKWVEREKGSKVR